MKFCMECGQKAPPAAKFCPGCGNAMSLKNNAKVDEEVSTEETADIKVKDITLPLGSVVISGGDEGTTTVKQVVEAAGEGYQPQNIVRPRNTEFVGLTKEELAQKLRHKNRSDGSKEA